MTDDGIERSLGEAFDARARSSVPSDAPVPPPRFEAAAAQRTATSGRHRSVWLAPVAAAAVVVAVAALVFGLTRGSGPQQRPAAARPPASSGSSSAHRATSPPSPPSPTLSGQPATPSVGPATSSPKIAAVAKPVRVVLQTAASQVYGVGMPVVALMSHRITDAAAFQKATRVTVNGESADAAWYFELSAEKGYPLAAHLRLQNYWPAHSKVQVSMPIHGVSAGDGYRFADDLQLNFATGARTIAVVDDRTHQMTVTTDGRRTDIFPVSLGARQTPTSNGTKIVMAKGGRVCMHGPGYHSCDIKDAQQLTNDGEYLHAAPWNAGHIKRGIDSSNGCVNMLPGDASKLYQLTRVGDVVQFPDADGPPMTAGDGLGDWNVSWKVWRTGGVVPTH